MPLTIGRPRPACRQRQTMLASDAQDLTNLCLANNNVQARDQREKIFETVRWRNEYDGGE